MPKSKRKTQGNSHAEVLAAIEARARDSPLCSALCDFAAMRQKLHKPFTVRAVELLFGELHKLAPDDEKTQVKIVEQSILNGWQAVYPLKNSQGMARAGSHMPERPGARASPVTLAEKNAMTGMQVLAELEQESRNAGRAV